MGTRFGEGEGLTNEDVGVAEGEGVDVLLDAGDGTGEELAAGDGDAVGEVDGLGGGEEWPGAVA